MEPVDLQPDAPTTATRGSERSQGLADLLLDTLIQSGASGVAIHEVDGTLRVMRHSGEAWWDRYDEVVAAINPDDRRRISTAFKTWFASPDGGEPVEYRVHDRHGREHYVRSVGVNLLRDPRVAGVIVASYDLTEAHDLQEQIVGREALGRAVLDSLTTYTAVLDANGVIVAVNDAWRTSPSPEWQRVIEPGTDYIAYLRRGKDRSRAVLAAFDEVNRTGQRTAVTIDLPFVIGRESRWFHCEIAPLKGSEGSVITFTDVTERKIAGDHLAHLAIHDPLTGLLNRRGLADAIEKGLASQRPMLLLFIDLDNFKIVNDSVGHDVGDLVLVEVARRLEAVVDELGLAARFGGDEFCVLSYERESDSLRPLSDRLRLALSEPIELDGFEAIISASMGQARATTEHLAAIDLLRQADAALYQAKAGGRDRVEIYSEITHERLLRRNALERDLRIAVGEHRLMVFFQPQVDLVSRRVVGVEALVRWRDERRGGFVSPVEFVPVAEEIGLIKQIDRFVLREACAAFAAWRHLGDAAPRSVSVNLSARDLEDPELVMRVADVLQEHDISPEQLHLEITEGVFLDRTDAATNQLEELRRLGVFIGLDDFGTGYSSMAQLRDLPIEVLKLDRTFVDGLGTDIGDLTITTAVVNMASALGLHIVAEGVESELQAEILLSLGCRVAQGFLFAPALPAATVDDLCRRRLGVTTVPSFRRARRRPGQRRLIDELMFHIGLPVGDQA